MIKTIYIKLSVAFSLLAVTINAQQNNLLNTYSYDLMQLNIASIGSKCTDVNLNYRTQWASVKENPKTFQLNASIALGANTGLGIKVRQQILGLLTFNNITGGYAYRVRLNSKTKLHLGVGLSWQQNVFNASKAVVVDAADNTVTNGNLRANNFDAEVGALVLGEKLTLGLSANNIYNTNAKFIDNAFTMKQQVNAVLAYKFNKGKNVEVEPWLINRYTVGGKNQIEGLLNFKFLQCVTLGAGYRSSYGVIGLAGFEKNVFKIVYSYDYNMGQQTMSYGSSHQIMLGINLCPKPKAKPEPIVVSPPVKEEPVAVKQESKKVEPVKVEEPKKVEPVVEIKKAEVYKTSIADINNLAESISFGVGKTTLDAEGLKKLNAIAEALKKAPDLKVSIEGRASPDGNKALNDALSLKRAEYVKAELIKRGINPNNLKGTVGVGSDKATSTQQNNRTVRFIGTN